MTTTSLNHTPSRQAVAALILIFVAALFMAPAAFAGCKNGKGKCNQPPNPTPASPGYSITYFDDGNFHVEEEGAALECESQTGNTAAEGQYYCTGEGGGQLPKMHLTTLGLTGLYSNKYRTDCKALSIVDFGDPHPYAMLDLDELSYGWVDDCTDGSCRIEVNMAFSGAQIFDETGIDADRMTVVLGGLIVDTPENEANPFLQGMVEVMADSAMIEYYQTGKSRPVVVCPFGIWHDPDSYHVLFVSEDTTP